MEELPYGVVQDNNGHKNIIFEATIDQSLQIWHAFFGLLGGNNEIHVLNKFPLVNWRFVDKWIYKQIGLSIF